MTTEPLADVAPGRSRPAATPPRALRLRIRLAGGALDRRLAGGADPLSDPQLALRAQHLVARRTRDRFAREIERVVETLSVRSLLPVRPVHVEAVQHAHYELRALAARLRDEEDVSERGMAMVSILLNDGREPLFNRDAGVPLRYSARMAYFCLDL